MSRATPAIPLVGHFCASMGLAQQLRSLVYDRRPGGSPATQGTPITVVSARRAPNMRRGSTEGVLHLERQRENRRGSFLFDLPHSGEALRSDSPPQAYDTLRSHDDVDADLDLARDTLPADAFTGSREVSELELQAAAQLAGSKSAPAAGAAGQQEMQMRSATEVRQAVSRARERLPSDEWSEEARRTTHQVLITFDAIAKPNDGFGDDGDDSSSLIVWRSPDEVSSGDIADSSGSSGGTALESYGLPQRLQPSHTAGPDDPTHPRQDSTAAPSVSPRRPGGINRSRQKTVWSAPMSSSGDEEHQQDWSDTDSDHDGEDGSGPAGEHGHHRLRSGSAGADDDGAHRIGGTGTDDGAQRIGGGSSNAGVGDSMRSLAPTGDQPVDGNGTSSTCLHSAASGDAMDSDGGLRGGGRTVVGDVPAVGNDGGMAQMLQMMSERCTKVQQEKHRLEERVTELEREKEEWETLKAQLISTLLNEGED